jgi:hypothetical protein
MIWHGNNDEQTINSDTFTNGSQVNKASNDKYSFWNTRV